MALIGVSAPPLQLYDRLMVPGPLAITNSDPSPPVCRICGKSVPLESAKTDGDGSAVHEACYVLLVRSDGAAGSHSNSAMASGTPEHPPFLSKGPSYAPIPKWRQLYESAILELDNTRMRERITAASAAILERVAEIQANPSAAEYRALDHALRTLRLLQQVIGRTDAA